MTALSFLWLLIPPVAGSVVLAAARIGREKVCGLLLGTTLGLATTATGTFGLTVLLASPKTAAWIILSALVILTGLLALPAWRHFRSLPLDRVGCAVVVCSALLGAALATRLLFITDTGALATNVLNAWGDLGWHVASSSTLAANPKWPPLNPILAGQPLIYPFLINTYSAQLLTVGATVVEATVAPAAVLLPVVFGLIYHLSLTLTQRRGAAVVATLLVLGSGAPLGWLNLLGNDNLPAALFARDLTGSGGDPTGFHFLNVILAALLPQRSFLLGLPLTLSCLLLLATAQRQRHYLAAGLAAGVLPLAHAHSLIALLPALVALTATGRYVRSHPLSSLVLFALPAATIGLPEVLYLISGSSAAQTFLRWQPGWTVGGHNLIWFWVKNTGLLLPLLVAAAAHRSAPPVARALATAGFTVFALSNLFAFAPWMWDNYKLLLYWLVFSAPLLGWLAADTISRGRAWAVVALLLVVFHTAAGAFDVAKTAAGLTGTFEEWNTNAIAFSATLAQLTPPGAAIASAPYHNNPAALAGRMVYLGYPGHVWSHGGEPEQREDALAELYTGRRAWLPDTPVRYAIVGPVERDRYPNLGLSAAWHVLATTGPYTLWRFAGE